jgi:hypothetical protein
VVAAQVCGITWTSNHSSSRAAMVRLMPSTAIDPLRIIQGARSAGNPMRRRRNSPFVGNGQQRADPVDVPLDDVSAQPGVDPQGRSG